MAYSPFASFFARVQASPWYADFLEPLLAAIEEPATVLDIGTGSGLFLRLLNEHGHRATGVDTSAAMLAEARSKLGNLPIDLHHITAGEPLPFAANQFATVTLANVLYLLPEQEGEKLLAEAQRVAQANNGTIIILHPSPRRKFALIHRYYRGWANHSAYLWASSTRRAARRWQKEQLVRTFCRARGLAYTAQPVFYDMAILERINL
jgi:ubiquinone/menaquinone biosynthesis C-methylase UbiE